MVYQFIQYCRLGVSQPSVLKKGKHWWGNWTAWSV